MKRISGRSLNAGNISAIANWLIIAHIFTGLYDVIQQVSVSAATSSSTNSFRANKIAKCCPEGYELKLDGNVTTDDLNDNLGLASRYSCIMTIWPFMENETSTAPSLFGYNLRISDSEVVFKNDVNNIPKCTDVELFQFDLDGGLISSDGCIDYLDGIVQGLKCSDREQVEVHKLFKCCPAGWSYDLQERQCVENANDLQLFGNLVGSSVALFEMKTPECRPEDVFVEYFTDKQNVMLQRSGVDVVSLLTGESEFLLPESFCMEGIYNNASEVTQLIIRSCRPRSVCHRMPCVRRCCKNDQMLAKINGTSQCVAINQNIRPIFHELSGPVEIDKMELAVDPPEYGLIHTQKCTKYLLLHDDPRDVHYISHIDGSLHILGETSFDNNNYCVENLKMGDEIVYSAFVCFQPYPQKKFYYYATGLVISSLFLWLTLVVYASLPKLLNLHGKTLVCHVTSMLLAYTALSVLQCIRTELNNCYILGYFIFFGFLSAFCWQTIMCFDIWWTFGSVRASRGMRKTKELRRFLLYSLYAWGVPSVLTTVTVMIDHYELVPIDWSPQLVNGNHCWFKPESWKGRFTYFLLPIGLHICTNSVLFILTSIHCSKVKSEIHRMQTEGDDPQSAKKRFIADKTKYVMNMKLFIVMGVSWILEILATILQKPEALWYFSDVFNILQGVLVFFIFVFKWKVWTAIQQRLGIHKDNKTGTTNATATTYVSGSTSKDSVNMNRNGKLAINSSNSTLASSNVNLANVRKA